MGRSSTLQVDEAESIHPPIHPPTWLEHPEDLAEALGFVGGVAGGLHGKSAIERLFFPRQGLEVPLVQLGR